MTDDNSLFALPEPLPSPGVSNAEEFAAHLDVYGWVEVPESDLVRWAGFQGPRISRSPKVQAELCERVPKLLSRWDELAEHLSTWWWRETDHVRLFRGGLACKVPVTEQITGLFPRGDRHFIVVEAHGEVTLWRQDGLAPIKRIVVPMFDFMLNSTMTTDGLIVLAHKDGLIHVIDAETLSVVAGFEVPEDLFEEAGMGMDDEDGELYFDPDFYEIEIRPGVDGKVTVFTGRDTYWTLNPRAPWESEEGSQSVTSSPGVLWSPRAGSSLAPVRDPDGAIRIVDSSTGRIERVLDLKAAEIIPWSVGTAFDDTFLVRDTTGRLLLCDMADGRILGAVPGTRGSSEVAIRLRNGKVCIAGWHRRGEEVVRTIDFGIGRVDAETYHALGEVKGMLELSGGKVLIASAKTAFSLFTYDPASAELVPVRGLDD